MTLSQLDQAGEMLIPRLSMFEEPFTRGEQGEDHQGRAPLTQLGPPMPPEGRVPGDPPLGVLLYWIAADLIVRSPQPSTSTLPKRGCQYGVALVAYAKSR